MNLINPCVIDLDDISAFANGKVWLSEHDENGDDGYQQNENK